MRSLTKWELKRRDFLTHLGLGAALLPLLGESRSVAQASGAPTRFIVMVKANGSRPEDFWPKVPAGSSLANATLPFCTEPLMPFRDRLLFPDGLALRNWLRSEGNPTGDNGDAHHNWGSLLSGQLPADRLLSVGGCRQNENPPGCRMQSGGPSIDTFIGRELQKRDPTILRPSVAIGVRGGRGGNGFDTASWFDRDQPNTPENDPVALYASLFGAELPPGTVDKVALEKLRVLDFVGKDLERFSKRLGTEDRMAIQGHLEAVRMRHAQLGTLLDNPISCSKPAAPGGMGGEDVMTGRIPAIMTDLLVDAMKCGITRTACFSLFDTNAYDVYFTWLKDRNPNFSDDRNPGLTVSEFPLLHFHSLAHGAGREPGATMYRDANRWQVEQLAYLLARLDAEPEGTGTMLDSTVVLWVDSLSNGGGHSVFRMPWLVVSKSNAHLRTGRYINLSGDPAVNGLFVAIANAMGTPPPGDVFGDPKFGKGALAGLA